MTSINPIFITGIYRSGTTLISRMLNNHPNLNITYDSVHFMRFSFDNYNPIHEKSNYLNLINEIKNRLKDRWDLILDHDIVINEIEKYEKIDYSTIYDSIMSTLLLKNSDAQNWGEKTNVCWRKIPDFISMFPKGKTILMIRDPRDILLSYKNMTTEPGLRYLDSVFACLDAFKTAKKFQNNLSKHNFCLIKYEDLITNPKNVLEKVCDFLEIKFEPTMLESEKFKDKSGKLWESNSAFKKKMTGISKDSMNRWKKTISNVELYFVEMILREEILEFSYELGASNLSKSEWDELFEILNDDFIKNRYSKWLKTGSGHQKYPNESLE